MEKITAPKLAPRAVKLDPPSWWAGSSVNPVRVLITGENLKGVRLSCDGAGISLGAPKVSANGRYLFVDAKISPKAKPGIRTIKVGSSSLQFEVLPNVSRKRALPRLSSDDTIYLVMPDRFARGGDAPQSPLIDRSLGRSYHGGNLQGVIDKLGYLKDLGVTALWLTPVYANSDKPFAPTYYSDVPFTNYHGYGPVDFYSVDKRLGDMKTLKSLVDAAHAAGIKIILDQVANHSSPHHAWVKDPPSPSWYHGTPENHINHPFTHWVAADPNASEEAKRAIMDGWLGNELPDLNQDEPEVERYLIQNMLWWIGVAGFDAWRHDSMNYVPRAFWKKYAAALKKEFPGFPNVAEVNSDDPYLQSRYQDAETGMDACFDFPLRRAIRNVFLDGKPMSELPAALSRDGLYKDPSMLVTFAGLHDDPRFMGHPKASAAALKLAFTFLMTTRGIPMVYAADEIAMPGGDDPDNRRDFPGGWAEDARNAFTKAGRTADEDGVFEHVKKLANLRASCEALRRGKLAYISSSETHYAYSRALRGETVVVVLNNSDRPASIEVPKGTGKAFVEVAAKSSVVLTTRTGGRTHG
jgi:neopullulanase